MNHPRPPTFDPALTEFLPEWLARQRWYAGKGHTPALTWLAGLRWQDAGGQVEVETHLVLDSAGEEPVLYHVPLTYRSAPLPEHQAGRRALVTTAEDAELGTRWIYDACYDPVYVQALLDSITGTGALPDLRSGTDPQTGAELEGGVDSQSGADLEGADGAAVRPEPAPTARRVTVRSSRVLRGEQSNTSIVVNSEAPAGDSDALAPSPGGAGPGAGREADAHPEKVIIKVFRVLRPGTNPDVHVASALAAGGSGLVPAPVGALWASWLPASGGHLAFASEFLPGGTDGWVLALQSASGNTDFTAQALALGEVTAHLHQQLREVFDDHDSQAEEARAGLIADVRARFGAASADVPELGRYAGALEQVIAAARAESDWPPVQRVHGDYHLGQLLHTPDRGWVVLDFEGEPLRPIDQRSAPSFALRDVAGMLRSFDYAAGSVAAQEVDAPSPAADPPPSGITPSGTTPSGITPSGMPPSDAALSDRPSDAASDPPGDRSAWARATRAAFLEGYARAGGAVTSSGPGTGARPGSHQALLRLLEIDKACYEASYEARNRPDWVHIPVSAIRSLFEEYTVTTPDPDTPDVPSAEPSSDPSPEPSREVPTEPVEAAPLPVDAATLATIARGEHYSPHDVLGAHLHDGVVTFRTLRQLAQRVRIVTSEQTLEARHEQDGIWVATMAGTQVPDYRVEVNYDGKASVVDDPYRFWPTLGQVDLHLIAEGRHERLWEALGAHVRAFPGELGTVRGTSFAVWAPNAEAVRVVGEFNAWDGTAHAMRALGSTGVWELFIPGVGTNSTYKFEIRSGGTWRTKADPMARATEHPPATASVVTDTHYVWGDGQWMSERAQRDPHTGPMSTYEVHLGSWRPGLGYRDLADQLVEYVTWMGFTHVQFMPVAEHPFGGSWGYQVTSYYAPSARFGSPDEFRYLVDSLHQAGIGVLVDWVPAHFPKDDFALARFDGTALYEDPDPLRGEQLDWGTFVFNFGRNEVRNFLVANALYWLREFHIDGLRVDAVASMLYLDYSRDPGQWRPNVRGGRENLEAIQFLQEANATAYRTAPGIVMIAEESTAWPGVTAATEHGGLGFGLKWNMGWMNDTLRYLSEEPINRRYHHGELTFSLVYAFSEQYVLPLSHDEVVHGKGSLLRKMPGDRWNQLAGVRALLAYQWSHPGKKLLFMGSEFAQEAEWSEAGSLDWAQGDSPGHAGVRLALRRLNEVYREHPALWADDFSHAGFEWLEANDGDRNVIAYLRKAPPAATDAADDDASPRRQTAGITAANDDGASPRGQAAAPEVVAVVINFAGAPHEDYRIGLPHGGEWDEVFNSDAEEYGGSGVGNLGRVRAEEVPWRGQRYSVTLRVPPLGAVFLVPART